MWTGEQKEEIVCQYFRTLSRVRCPDDDAFLDIHDRSRIGGVELFVFCPFCKQEFSWEKTEEGQKWTDEQKEEFIKNELRGKASECPNCGSMVEVEREREYGSGEKLPYTIKCRYCMLFEEQDF